MAGQLLLINPRKRRTVKRRKNPESRAKRSRAARKGWARRAHHSVRRVTHRRRNPIRHHRRRNPIRHHRRRNPIGRKMHFFAPVMPAVMGAVGAIGLSALWGYAPIPASMKTGTMGYAVKAAGALAVGAGLGMMMKKQTAEALTVGMLTVVLADALKGILQPMMPSISLGEIMPDPSMAGLGYISPAITLSNQPQALTDGAGNGGYSYDFNAQQVGAPY